MKKETTLDFNLRYYKDKLLLYYSLIFIIHLTIFQGYAAVRHTPETNIFSKTNCNYDLSVDTGNDQEICPGEETTLTANVTGTNNCQECKTYTIDNTNYCLGNQDFVIWLTNADKTDKRWFSNIDLTWNELNDGTATLKGTVLEYTRTQEIYTVDITYSGKTTVPPLNSPKEHSCIDENPEGWIYYPNMEGTISKADNSESYRLSRRGESFQVGNGANVFEREASKNGASGWINVENGPFAYGDVNINFGECLASNDNNIQYLWSTGETTQSITVSPEEDTIYNIEVTGCSGCISTDQVTVSVNNTTVDAGENQYICLGDATTLTAIGEGDVLWSTGETSNTIEVAPTETTLYSVIITNNNCTATDEVMITVDEANIYAGEDQTITIGETAILTAIGEGDIIWSTGETSQTITVTPTETTEYSVTVTRNNCSATDQVIVYVNPCNIIADAGEDQNICSVSDVTPTKTKPKNEETVTLTASGGESYLWSTGETTQNITVSPTEDTTYTVIVTEGSCSAIDDVTVFVTKVDADAGKDIDITIGESATLTVTGGDRYVWSTGETSQDITVTPAITTIYQVTAYKGNCYETDKVVVVVNCLETEAGNDITICAGESAELKGEGGDIYIWQPGNFTTQSITVSPLETTTYTVTTIKNSCIDTDQVTVYVENCEDDILFGNGKTELKSLHPTVAKFTDAIQIDIATLLDQDQILVRLYNLNGQLISNGFETTVYKGDNSLTFDLSTLHSIEQGIYLIKLTNQDGSLTKKIVIE